MDAMVINCNGFEVLNENEVLEISGGLGWVEAVEVAVAFVYLVATAFEAGRGFYRDVMGY